MRILSIGASLGRGGTERAVETFSLGFQRLGHDVAVLAWQDGGLRQARLEEHGIEVFIGGADGSVGEMPLRSESLSPIPSTLTHSGASTTISDSSSDPVSGSAKTISCADASVNRMRPAGIRFCLRRSHPSRVWSRRLDSCSSDCQTPYAAISRDFRGACSA